MGCTERTPIDDDAEKAEIRPLEACIPLSIQGTVLNESVKILTYTGAQSQYAEEEY